MAHSHKCPSCRCDLPYEMAANPKVSTALAEALEILHPAEAASRREEAAELPPLATLSGLTSLPLFVLEPILPGQVMHLHVFEPRYIMLMRRALSEPALDRCFGMLAMARGGLARYGTTVRILDHTELRGGRFYVTVQGVRRFRVLRTSDMDGYRNAAVAWASDVPAETLAETEPPGSAGADVVASVSATHTTLLCKELRGAMEAWMRAVAPSYAPMEQMERIHRDLGPMPTEGANTAERLGLWAAACLNPLPPLGLAPEIRLMALETTDSLARLRLVLTAAEVSTHQLLARPRLGSWLSAALRPLFSHHYTLGQIAVIVALLGIVCIADYGVLR